VQQHIIRTAVVSPVAVNNPETAVFTAEFFELFFLFFIFRNLIYLSPSFTGVGFGTGFPISGFTLSTSSWLPADHRAYSLTAS